MSERRNKPHCKFCKKSSHNLFRGVCKDCDTSAAGTWFLSYLSSLGFINNDDTIQNGYVYGTTNKNFLGIPDGTEIFCQVDEKEKDIFHLKYDPKAKLVKHDNYKNYDSDQDDEYDDDDKEYQYEEYEDDKQELLLSERNDVSTIVFKVNIGIDIIDRT